MVALKTNDYELIVAKPFSPNLGAEIYGVDLSQNVPDDQFAEIRDAFQKYQVLFLSMRHKQRVNAQGIGLVKFLGQFLQRQKVFGLNRRHDTPSHALCLCVLQNRSAV